MKKFLVAVLMVCILNVAFCFASAEEWVLAGKEVYYGNTKLDASVYADGSVLYVPLEALMELLGGNCEMQGNKVTVSLDSTGGKATAGDGVIYEDDHIVVTFSGFAYSGVFRDGGISSIPKIVITNKTNAAIQFKIDWKQFYMNGCQVQPSNTSQEEVRANGKYAFPAASCCVVDLGKFTDYGETVIRHIDMDVDLTYGKKTQRVTWSSDCNIPVDSIQPE